ncbi:TetR/AcrR family transcriptional regulator [Paractinoplanes brasiliensis]|uniref:TetR family transcriptional regulator n=1 Tax=Paractinoplanes brasiliensis TaxID=52695 RepID=A0A4R6J961_9ACTN|nr:TetR/AcrR family transcriptional regulator [Actinoplanes brasiliensis]TDO32163.1 TetR family transcriptional regulator [Actinoplanes brasiliensis]GID28217.1 TetR family transcriptional regulator [Actinoplanes brasiliensis]
MVTRTPLTRERVLEAAVALADRDGLAALTMRGLAAGLGVEAMSLYHHLPGKQALLDGVVECLLGEVTAAVAHEHAGDWRTQLRRQFLTARRVMLRHPWAPGLIASRTSVPPTVFAYYDGILATLVGAGFTYHLAHRALHAFGSMPLGFAQEVFAPGGDFEPEASEAELAAMAEALPHVTAMVASEIHDAGDPTLGWCDSQAEFEFTLDLLLNGLEDLRRQG